MGKKAPKPPNPYNVAALQDQLNRGTASWSQLASMMEQEGPDGSLTYEPTGTRSWKNPLTGQMEDVPIYTARTRLSAEQQAIKDRTDATKLNLARLAETMSGDTDMTKPFNVDEALQGTLEEGYLSRLRTNQVLDRENQEADMLARGIRPDSEAYSTFKKYQGQKENDATGQMLMNARKDAFNESLTKYELPFRRMMSLISGSAYESPNFGNVSKDVSSPTIDMGGLINQDYQNRLAAAQQKNQSLNQALGGMFGVAGNFIKYSDRRLKQNVEKVGETADDLGIYKYRYKGGGPMRLGLIAQDVEKKMPGAVSKDPRGYRRVDYRKALHLGV